MIEDFVYERFAVGSIAREHYLSGEAFQVFADLAGASAREPVRRLPARELNKVPSRPRSSGHSISAISRMVKLRLVASAWSPARRRR